MEAALSRSVNDEKSHVKIWGQSVQMVGRACVKVLRLGRARGQVVGGEEGREG